eukprot:5784590-Pyramimonas_sp.AAC.1
MADQSGRNGLPVSDVGFGPDRAAADAAIATLQWGLGDPSLATCESSPFSPGGVRHPPPDLVPCVKYLQHLSHQTRCFVDAAKRGGSHQPCSRAFFSVRWAILGPVNRKP